VNCDQKLIKNEMFSLNEQQLQSDLEGEIIVLKSLSSPEKEVKVASYKIKNFTQSFHQLMEKFIKRSAENVKRCGKFHQPCCDVIKELVQLVNEDDLPCGTLYYTLRLTCFGTSFSLQMEEDLKSMKSQKAENKCLNQTSPSSPCAINSKDKESEFDEYATEINGNQLLIRVQKREHPLTLKQIFPDEKEVKRGKNVVSIFGCDQQIDFNFPEKFSCGDSKPKSKDCACSSNSLLTAYQKKTSCVGKSLKNSCCLPVIRGNLKYPGNFDNGSIKIDLFNKCVSQDTIYKKKPSTSRGVCMQVDEDNLNRELNGEAKLPKGIQVCKKGCSDPDTDVFILKIGSKKKSSNGKQNQIELELRTPKLPDHEVKKKETREIQVDEIDFEEVKPVKKQEEKKESPKGFTKKTPESKKVSTKSSVKKPLKK
jgi:hypothetical protein